MSSSPTRHYDACTCVHTHSRENELNLSAPPIAMQPGPTLLLCVASCRHPRAYAGPHERQRKTGPPRLIQKSTCTKLSPVGLSCIRRIIICLFYSYIYVRFRQQRYYVYFCVNAILCKRTFNTILYKIYYTLD